MSTAGPAEIAVLIVIAVLMFGPDKLPEMARKAARIYPVSYTHLRAHET